jgi:hypothetical protein
VVVAVAVAVEGEWAEEVLAHRRWCWGNQSPPRRPSAWGTENLWGGRSFRTSRSLAMDGEVIFMPPCLFCMENHNQTYMVRANDFTPHGYQGRSAERRIQRYVLIRQPWVLECHSDAA